MAMLARAMPASAVLWLSCVVTFAAWLVAHLALLVAVAGDAALSRGWRIASLVPPVLPVAAWRARRRPGAVAWTILLLIYLGLRGYSLVR